MRQTKQWYRIRATKNKTAQILIYEHIGQNWLGEGVSAKRFVEDLQALDVDSIELHINSPGGNVFDGNAIYNSLKAHKAKIDVKIDGIAASIASVIAMSGNTVEMPENAMLMIHNPSGVVIGTAEDMSKMADNLEKVKIGLVAAYHDKSQLDNDQISEMMTDETWITASEALKYGLADEITERVNIQANFEDLSQYKNVPENFLNGITGKIKKQEENPMPKQIVIAEITLDLIRAEHPTIVTDLIDEGKKTGAKEGAESERNRIKAVQDQLIPGHEKLINGLMWDGKTTGEQAAVQVLAAEKATRVKALADNQADAPAAVAQAAADDPEVTDPNLPIEDKCKAKWVKNKALQDEFDGDFDSFLAYAKAADDGKVKIIAKK